MISTCWCNHIINSDTKLKEFVDCTLVSSKWEIKGIMSSSIVQLLNIYLDYIMEIIVYSFGSSFDVSRHDKRTLGLFDEPKPNRINPTRSHFVVMGWTIRRSPMLGLSSWWSAIGVGFRGFRLSIFPPIYMMHRRRCLGYPIVSILLSALQGNLNPNSLSPLSSPPSRVCVWWWCEFWSASLFLRKRWFEGGSCPTT